MSDIESDKPDDVDIDESVKEMVDRPIPEDPFIVEYMKGNAEETEEKDPVNVTSEWIGDSDNWKVKSNLTAEQITALIQVRNMSEVWPELEPIQKVLDSVVEDMEQYVVSHQGNSRGQHVDVLRAMHAGETDPTEDAGSAIVEAFAASRAQEED